MKVQSEMKKPEKKNYAILIVSLLLFIIAGFGIAGYFLLDYRQTDILYNSVKTSYTTTDTPEYEEPEDDGFPDFDVDIDGLIEANPDFLCWLYYEDGKIDYPVVKEREDDINGWMHSAFDGSSKKAGTIFMPYDADSSFCDMNTFLYGHNMANGSIFGSLKLIYRNPKENYKDPYFYIWTKDYEKIKYRVISVYVVNKNSSMYAVPLSDEGYEKYIADVLNSGSMSGFIPFTGIEKTAMDESSPIVSLSTCYGYAGTSNRLLVQGVEIDRRPYKEGTLSDNG